MDKLFRRILFFILIPIYAPLSLFMNLTYAKWMAMYKGNESQKIMFYVLWIIYRPIAFFMELTYGWWAGLTE